MSEEMDFAQLVAQEDEINLLRKQVEQLEAESKRMKEARLIELALWRAAREECDRARDQCADWADELRKITDAS
jgi:hypothetical protein